MRHLYRREMVLLELIEQGALPPGEGGEVHVVPPHRAKHTLECFSALGAIWQRHLSETELPGGELLSEGSCRSDLERGRKHTVRDHLREVQLSLREDVDKTRGLLHRDHLWSGDDQEHRRR